MASNNGGIQPLAYQQFQCEECSLSLNSAASLVVHCKYHHLGNTGHQWTGENKDGAVNQQRAAVKREFPPNMQQQADMPKSSPNYQRTTPDAAFGQPPTPKSYHSSNSPFQNAETTPLYPIFSNFPNFKRENLSPPQQQNELYPTFANYPDHSFGTGVVESGVYPEDPTMRTFHNEPLQEMCRQYSVTPKQGGAAQAENGSFSTQPTPSPSPKQCDKCRFASLDPTVFMEHMTSAHQVSLADLVYTNQLMFEQQAMTKEEESASNAILDLDSQKVVHSNCKPKIIPPHFQPPRKRPHDESNISHPNNTMLWYSSHPNNLFNGECGFPYPARAPIASGNNNEKQYTTLTKFSPNQVDASYLNNPTSCNADMGSLNQQQQQHIMSNRSYEQAAVANNASISGSQVPAAAPPSAPPNTKSSNWKSNEARRPKTYNCTACNKWFTSSGHLKRHYNTTLHKNAVKSSGQPDPATMPISAHHHPSREATSSKDGRQSMSPRDDESNNSQYGGRMPCNMPLMQHPTNQQYESSGQDQLESDVSNGVLGGHFIANFPTNLPNVSPPNGTAGLSAPETRGLMPMAPTSFSMISQPQLIPMDVPAPQYQIYPNEFTPHVSQAMDTTTLSNLNGEQVQYLVNVENHQPLPSFAQIQAHLGGGYANVGGLESVMTSISYFPNQNDGQFGTTMYDLNRLVATEQPQPQLAMEAMQFSAIANNNNNDTAFVDMSASVIDANMTAMAPDAAGGASASEEPAIMTAADESKENESENGAADTESSNVSSASNQNQEDLSKTKCFDCDKVFNRPCYLTQHNKTCHNGDKPFKCSRCGKRYATEDVYRRHEGKHAGNKPHKCLMCPKMFNHKTDLRRHICCHTGKKPYACTICDKGFIRKDHMVKHVDTHMRKREKQSAMRS